MLLYFPAFFDTPQEKDINSKLRLPATLAWNINEYRQLWKLKKHTERVTASIHQLQFIVPMDQTLNDLKVLVSSAFALAIEGKKLNRTQHTNRLENCFYILESELSESATWDISFSCLNLISNTFIIGLASASTLLFTATALAGPGPMLLPLALAVIASSLTMIAAYSMYVDIRFARHKQLTEIKEGIDFLCANYCPDYESESTNEDSLAYK
ncbi:hypothetical protein ACD661_01795 [Legionella lytica]|uniref:DUF5638 domain-containing protein n=1 Tax=Legionella lytica TaxID=96232 RepID=A0ABW8D6R8_9GAMM